MPPDWKPAKAAQAKAVELGLDPDAEEADFRDWTAAKRMLYADWDAGFRSHLTGQARRHAKINGTGPPAKPLPIFASSVGKPWSGEDYP